MAIVQSTLGFVEERAILPRAVRRSLDRRDSRLDVDAGLRVRRAVGTSSLGPGLGLATAVGARHRPQACVARHPSELDPDVEIGPVDGVADLVDPVDHAGQLLVQAGPDEVVDLDQVEPARAAQSSACSTSLPGCGRRPARDRVDRLLALVEAEPDRAREDRVEDQEVGDRVARARRSSRCLWNGS